MLTVWHATCIRKRHETSLDFISQVISLLSSINFWPYRKSVIIKSLLNVAFPLPSTPSCICSLKFKCLQIKVNILLNKTSFPSLPEHKVLSVHCKLLRSVVFRRAPTFSIIHLLSQTAYWISNFIWMIPGWYPTNIN